MRHDRRRFNQMREVKLERGVIPFAEGSCVVEAGRTKVLVTASVEKQLPAWLRDSGKGWVTAEYSMLPRSNRQRTPRERTRSSGRSQEIQRLVGRSLRAIVDLELMPATQIVIDCDVLVGDGGTRCAAITAGYLALRDAVDWCLANTGLKVSPLKDSVAAVSAGLLSGKAVLDLDYEEDSSADVDANFVITGKGRIVEIQMTAEKATFGEPDLQSLFKLGKYGCGKLAALQKAVLQGPAPSR